MTGKFDGIGSDLAKVDAYQNGPADYEEIPELTAEAFARGVLKVNGMLSKRGRPAPNGAKRQLTLRLDPAVIDGFKATGPGWQARINDVLRAWLTDRAGASALEAWRARPESGRGPRGG